VSFGVVEGLQIVKVEPSHILTLELAVSHVLHGEISFLGLLKVLRLIYLEVF
jgi:hypothetical protein